MNISIEHVTKKIKDATVLKDICLEMKGGTVYGLQGKNGSGKTMLMRAISGTDPSDKRTDRDQW